MTGVNKILDCDYGGLLRSLAVTLYMMKAINSTTDYAEMRSSCQIIK